jgi:hypothetical protein
MMESITGKYGAGLGKQAGMSSGVLKTADATGQELMPLDAFRRGLPPHYRG